MKKTRLFVVVAIAAIAGFAISAYAKAKSAETEDIGSKKDVLKVFEAVEINWDTEDTDVDSWAKTEYTLYNDMIVKAKTYTSGGFEKDIVKKLLTKDDYNQIMSVIYDAFLEKDGDTVGTKGVGWSMKLVDSEGAPLHEYTGYIKDNSPLAKITEILKSTN